MQRKAKNDAVGVLHQIIVRGIERRNILRDNICLDSFVNRFGREKTC